ncbi:RluA family pseudouridine synthase [Furfurilactobacillus siliginis]|uniref:Pseudouridine synthase n=1 Tax=Furfurilactobacillus siliginis TaxID=348151 RepID=A0A0R2KZW6_9LACO|nr:RluA family pseudouridine synthase [Furfurilactobacillus siliginis]
MKQFLFAQGVSHNLWVREAANRELTLNGQVTTPDWPVEPGDIVGYSLPNEPSDPRIAVSQLPIAVSYADSNWLVINKEAGVSSVPGPTNQKTTLLNRIKGWEQANHATDLVPRLVSRLDRDTSGLLLAARHKLAQAIITPQVENHQIKKEYLALIAGMPTENHGIIDAPIARVADQATRVISDDGQMAQTEYWVEETYGTVSLVRLQLHTGRTHQIRVHLAAIGHPLLGDTLYGGDTKLISRQALHASHLVFTDPFTHAKHDFTAQLPDDMQDVITQLSGSSAQ